MSVSSLSPSPNSTRPYLLRALYEWCTDNGFTPYIAAFVDSTVQVPREYVKNNEIVLNVSMDATSSLKLGNEFVEFKARFAGTAREIMVPISHVIAIYARENGQGMAFPMPASALAQGDKPELDVARLMPQTQTQIQRPQVARKLKPTKEEISLDMNPSKIGNLVPPKVVQLVSVAVSQEAPSDSPSDDDSPPPGAPSQNSPAGLRPTLKRIK